MARREVAGCRFGGAGRTAVRTTSGSTPVRRSGTRNRGHFFGIAARCMRQILVEHARARGATKRGGDAQRSDPAELLRIGSEPEVGILELDDALQSLTNLDSRKGRMIELHYFGGLAYDEMADAMGVSATTVKRDLRIARAWLRR